MSMCLGAGVRLCVSLCVYVCLPVNVSVFLCESACVCACLWIVESVSCCMYARGIDSTQNLWRAYFVTTRCARARRRAAKALSEQNRINPHVRTAPYTGTLALANPPW